MLKFFLSLSMSILFPFFVFLYIYIFYLQFSLPSSFSLLYSSPQLHFPSLTCFYSFVYLDLSHLLLFPSTSRSPIFSPHFSFLTCILHFTVTHHSSHPSLTSSFIIHSSLHILSPSSSSPFIIFLFHRPFISRFKNRKKRTCFHGPNTTHGIFLANIVLSSQCFCWETCY